jgi:hypothetical protein
VSRLHRVVQLAYCSRRHGRRKEGHGMIDGILQAIAGFRLGFRARRFISRGSLALR